MEKSELYNKIEQEAIVEGKKYYYSDSSFKEENQEDLDNKRPTIWNEILLLLSKIVFIGITFLILFCFIFGIFRYTDISMSPAIKDGDLVMFYRWDKDYVAQDTLVLEFDGKKQVVRVIATYGDVIDIIDDNLYINGSRQQEPHIYTKTYRYDTGVEFPITLKEDQIFVLGDNRENCTDSRVYGAVESDNTLGKVITIIRRRGI